MEQVRVYMDQLGFQRKSIFPITQPTLRKWLRILNEFIIVPAAILAIMFA